MKPTVKNVFEYKRIREETKIAQTILSQQSRTPLCLLPRGKNKSQRDGSGKERKDRGRVRMSFDVSVDVKDKQ